MQSKRTERKSRMKKMKEKIVEMLDEMAYNMPISTSCNFVWGEVEVPIQLKDAILKRKEMSTKKSSN